MPGSIGSPMASQPFFLAKREKFEQQQKKGRNVKMRWKTTMFWLVFLLLDFVFLPKNGWLSYNWFTDYTRCLSRFMVVVRRLVQFCLASVKSYFPANSSVHVCFIFQANNTEWSCMGSNTCNPTLLLPRLHLWNLRNCGSMACLRNLEGLVVCPKQLIVSRQP